MKSSFMRRILLILASYKEDTFELAVRFLQEEIRRTDAIGVRNIVLHPRRLYGQGCGIWHCPDRGGLE